jgi:hypothetical protein
MGISAEATETVAIALIAECRRCLSIGVDMKAPFIKACLAQLESATVNSLTARADVVPANDIDGRNAAEVVVIT